jgi:heterodisulfide reductase subunit A
MRSALDLADAGLRVFLVEQTPCLGGRVAQLGFMFPQHDCVLCRGTPDHGYGCTRPSISPAYLEHNQHPNIEILTNTKIMDVEGQAGDFTVVLRQEPRFVDTVRCINCGYCTDVCPVELPDRYQQGLSMRKAIYKVSARATPDAYVIDRGDYCDDCAKCAEVCPTKAINLDEKPRLRTVEVGAIILALGFQVFDDVELETFGYRRFPNVIHAMEYERYASRSGPTEGLIIRPSNHQKPKSIAWLQCIGSRNQENPFCSSICCMYATKEAILAKQRLGDSLACSVFMMDERAFNKEYRSYFEKARDQHHIQYDRCRISSVQEDPETHDLILKWSTPDGEIRQERYEMVVLATGLQPPEAARDLSRILRIDLNQFGFCQTDKFTPLQTSRPGVFVCGAFSSPKEIVETIIDASGAAAEVMRLLNDRLNTFPYSRELPFLNGHDLPPERDVSSEEVKTGLFACSCGDVIGKQIDLRELVHLSLDWPGVKHAEVVEYACLPEGLAHIQEILTEKDLNRLVVAGCSNRTHESLFQRVTRMAGLNPYLCELVNIREQCIRVHQWQPELSSRKAKELVRVAVGRVKEAQRVNKKLHRCRSDALVIGGGVAGMVAALAIADSGFNVHLVEANDMLGGNLLNLYYVAEGYNPQRLLRDLVNRTRSHQRIAVYLHTQVIRHDGHVGFFQTTLRTQRHDGIEEDTHLEHGVTIVATGAKESRDHSWLQIPGVITQRELEELLIHNPERIAALRHIVMIQCIRPEHGKDYCSRVCCTNTIKNALRIRLYNPACQVTIIYKNIVTYGFREEFYTEARRHGVIFVRYTDESPPLIQQEENHLVVTVRDPVLNRPLSLTADLVPLSMPIEPPASSGKLAGILGVPLSSEGFFDEAQMKLRPMDFMREGIFLAGMAHYPKFIEESISHALAAAARAMTLLSHESLYLGGVVAQVDPQKCVGCLTCTRTCPFSIPQIIKEEGRHGVGELGGAAYIDTAQCQGCGTCTAECPANAIQLVHFTDEQVMLRDIKGLGRWLPGQEHSISASGVLA